MHVNDLVPDDATSGKYPKPYANTRELVVGAQFMGWWVGGRCAELKHLESALVN